jgi:uncharacterized coiled-coil protein SlyX
MTVKYDPAVTLAYARADARRIMSDHEAANYDESVYTQRIAALEAELAARDRTIANFDFKVCPSMADRISTLEAALTLLTNGFKYSTEVVTIARDALGAK